MNRFGRLVFGTALLGAAALLAHAVAAARETDKNPFAGDAEAIAEGKALWLKAGCYSCHGHEAEGAVGPDLTDDQWVYLPTDATLFKAIAKGRPGTTMMALRGQLTDDDIWKIIAFIRSIYRGNPDKIIW
jgi:cytochrome c(L)